MSRTRRIYNSYKKYGRFFAKQGMVKYNIVNGKSIPVTLIPPFSLALEYHHKDESYNEQYFQRWHPFAVICMGNCHYCKTNRNYYRWKESKQNRKRKNIKFNF